MAAAHGAARDDRHRLLDPGADLMGTMPDTFGRDLAIAIVVLLVLLTLAGLAIYGLVRLFT